MACNAPFPNCTPTKFSKPSQNTTYAPNTVGENAAHMENEKCATRRRNRWRCTRIADGDYRQSGITGHRCHLRYASGVGRNARYQTHISLAEVVPSLRRCPAQTRRASPCRRESSQDHRREGSQSRGTGGKLTVLTRGARASNLAAPHTSTTANCDRKFSASATDSCASCITVSIPGPPWTNDDDATRAEGLTTKRSAYWLYKRRWFRARLSRDAIRKSTKPS